MAISSEGQEQTRAKQGNEPPCFLQPGAQVGRYRVERRLGFGAMSEVYLAIDDSLGRHAAVKILGSKQMHNPTVTERFQREARALAKMSHPNLIPVFESGQAGNPPRPYYAMELLEGGDTQKLLEERGPLPSAVVALIGAQAATGLGEAARAGIIHRDVKPANLGISRHGVLKVTDFGLAKSYAGDKNLTARGMVVGTADYIAPEQARGMELDERADVYALGCTLFHLLTGRPPFRAKSGPGIKEYVEVMRMHLAAAIPDPREFAADADAELGETIRSMMTKERNHRPTFDDIARRLTNIADRLNGELPRVTRELFLVSPTSMPVPEEPPPNRVTRPRAWPRMLLILAVAVAAGLAAAFWLSP